jgi:hypothetical protein
MLNQIGYVFVPHTLILAYCKINTWSSEGAKQNPYNWETVHAQVEFYIQHKPYTSPYGAPYLLKMQKKKISWRKKREGY